MSANEYLTIKDLLLSVWRHKVMFMGSVVFFTLLAVFYALSLPNIYSSDSLLSPVKKEESGGLNLASGQLGGLASIAGINLGSDSVDRVSFAIEVMKSRDFLSKFIERHEIKEEIIAGTSWNAIDDVIVFDNKIYDEKNKKWVRDPPPLRQVIPSAIEAREIFLAENLKIERDNETGMVRLILLNLSPTLARDWNLLLINDLNEEIRNRDLLEAKKGLEFLEKQLSVTNIAEVKSVIYELIEQNTKTLMFTEINEKYVFKIVDSPRIPEKKHGPRRALIVLFGLAFGTLLGLVAVFLMTNGSRVSDK